MLNPDHLLVQKNFTNIITITIILLVKISTIKYSKMPNICRVYFLNYKYLLHVSHKIYNTGGLGSFMPILTMNRICDLFKDP